MGELNLDESSQLCTSQLCTGLHLHWGQGDKQEPVAMDISLTVLDF